MDTNLSYNVSGGGGDDPNRPKFTEDKSKGSGYAIKNVKKISSQSVDIDKLKIDEIIQLFEQTVGTINPTDAFKGIHKFYEEARSLSRFEKLRPDQMRRLNKIAELINNKLTTILIANCKGLPSTTLTQALYDLSGIQYFLNERNIKQSSTVIDAQKKLLTELANRLKNNDNIKLNDIYNTLLTGPQGLPEYQEFCKAFLANYSSKSVLDILFDLSKTKNGCALVADILQCAKGHITAQNLCALTKLFVIKNEKINQAVCSCIFSNQAPLNSKEIQFLDQQLDKAGLKTYAIQHLNKLIDQEQFSPAICQLILHFGAQDTELLKKAENYFITFLNKKFIPPSFAIEIAQQYQQNGLLQKEDFINAFIENVTTFRKNDCTFEQIEQFIKILQPKYTQQICDKVQSIVNTKDSPFCPNISFIVSVIADSKVLGEKKTILFLQDCLPYFEKNVGSLIPNNAAQLAQLYSTWSVLKNNSAKLTVDHSFFRNLAGCVLHSKNECTTNDIHMILEAFEKVFKKGGNNAFVDILSEILTKNSGFSENIVSALQYVLNSENISSFLKQKLLANSQYIIKNISQLSFEQLFDLMNAYSVQKFWNADFFNALVLNVAKNPDQLHFKDIDRIIEVISNFPDGPIVLLKTLHAVFMDIKSPKHEFAPNSIQLLIKAMIEMFANEGKNSFAQFIDSGFCLEGLQYAAEYCIGHIQSISNNIYDLSNLIKLYSLLHEKYDTLLFNDSVKKTSSYTNPVKDLFKHVNSSNLQSIAVHSINVIDLSKNFGKNFNSYLSCLLSLESVRICPMTFCKNFAQNCIKEIANLEPRQVCQVARLFARIGIQHTELLGAINQYVLENGKDMSTADLTIITWSFITLGYVDSNRPETYKILGDMAGMIFQKLNKSSGAIGGYDSAIFKQLRSTLVFFLEKGISNVDKLYDHIVKLGVDWDTAHISRLQQDITDSLKKIQEGVHVEYKDNENYDFLVDIAIPSEHIAIEVQGPHHYFKVFDEKSTEPVLELSGPDLFKKRVLENIGWRVIFVPYYDWNNLRDVDKTVEGTKKEEYLKEILKKK